MAYGFSCGLWRYHQLTGIVEHQHPVDSRIFASRAPRARPPGGLLRPSSPRRAVGKWGATEHGRPMIGDSDDADGLTSCSCHASCPLPAPRCHGPGRPTGFGLTFDVETPVFNTLLALSRHNKTSTFSFTLPLLNCQQTLLVSGAHQRPKPNRRATRGPSRLRRPRAPRRTPRSPPPPPCPSTCRAP